MIFSPYLMADPIQPITEDDIQYWLDVRDAIKINKDRSKKLKMILDEEIEESPKNDNHLIE